MDEKTIQYLKIEKEKADFSKKIFGGKSYIDKRYKILRDATHISFPLKKEINGEKSILNKIEDLPFMEIVSDVGVENEDYIPRNLHEALKNKIDQKYIHLIPSSIDIIGSKKAHKIAIIEFPENAIEDPEEYGKFKSEIANAILQVNQTINSVFEKKSKREGIYRTRELDFLSGFNKTETVHKENDCIFKLDVKKVFFSPRLLFERDRITSSGIRESQIVLDMFCGVGPFSIQIAKKCNADVYAIDINPDAIDYLKENVRLNKVESKVHCFQMDAKELLSEKNELGILLKDNTDRIIMNLPKNSIEFLEVACYLIKKRAGIIHFYQITKDPEPLEEGINNFKTRLRDLNHKIDEIFHTKVVKNYSPHKYLTVIDVKIK